MRGDIAYRVYRLRNPDQDCLGFDSDKTFHPSKTKNVILEILSSRPRDIPLGEISVPSTSNRKRYLH